MSNPDSVLAILAAFGPSVSVVSPFLPVPILAAALLFIGRPAIRAASGKAPADFGSSRQA